MISVAARGATWLRGRWRLMETYLIRLVKFVLYRGLLLLRCALGLCNLWTAQLVLLLLKTAHGQGCDGLVEELGRRFAVRVVVGHFAWCRYHTLWSLALDLRHIPMVWWWVQLITCVDFGLKVIQWNVRPSSCTSLLFLWCWQEIVKLGLDWVFDRF